VPYVSRCKRPRCQARATLIAEKVDGAGRHVRQIELCTRHCNVVINRERARGLGDVKHLAEALSNPEKFKEIIGRDPISI
jgi:UDP-N-acetylenolpyruvoylglucosamine reductase